MSQVNKLKRLFANKKLAMMVPIVFVSGLTIVVWLLGIVGTADGSGNVLARNKLNMSLPNALPMKDSAWSKLQFYEQADKDSAKYRSLRKDDPYFNLAEDSSIPSDSKHSLSDTIKNPSQVEFKNFYESYPASIRDANEEKVYKKLTQLNTELQKTDGKAPENTSEGAFSKSHIVSEQGSIDADRLENMMKMMNDAETTGDPEMNKINGMLDKILDIQHPERIKEELRQKSENQKGQVFTVSEYDREPIVSSFGSKVKFARSSGNISSNESEAKNGFYSLKESPVDNERATNGIKAIIDETQSLVNGSIIKLRLLSDIYVNGRLITKGKLLFGECSLNGERLEIEINTIPFKDLVIPVALSVYDLDGLKGIYIPGAITRDVAKQSTEHALQAMNIASLDPSLGAQAATAGIQAAKSLIGKKAKLVRVTVKTGHQVLLHDTNAKD